VKRSLVMLVMAVLIPNTTLAQSAPAPESKTDARPAAADVKQIDPVVVTATKVETPQSQLGAAVSIVTEDEVRTYHYSGIEEALRNVPGVEIQRSGSLGKTTSIKIRGAGAEQVVVLVDGMRVSSPTLGLTELADLTLDGIDRVEIVRGPQSTLYGADAIGGVVNIITKKGQGPPQGSVWVEGGSYGTIREQANVQGSYGGFNYNVSASRYDTRGQFDNDDSDLSSVNGRIGYDFPWKGELSLTGRYSKLNLDLPVFSTTPRTVFDPNAQSQSETYFYTLAYRQPILDWWDVRVRYGQWWNNAGFRNLPPPGSFTTISQIDTRRQEAEVVTSFRIGSWNTLTLGYENRAEQGYNRATFREALETHSGFVEDQLAFWDRLFLSGGVRYESNSVFGHELTPRVAAAIVIKETATKLRATWGKGFRAPTINDLFFPGFGNAALQPEHSESYDAGFDQKLWRNRIRFGSTFFHNRFSNLIQIVFDPVTFQAAPFNVGRAITEGVETYVEADVLDWLLVWANHTWTRTRDLSTGLPLRRFAENRWNGGVTATPIERLTLFVQAHVVGKQFEASSVGRNPGYYRLDLGGTFRLLGRVGAMERLDLTARIDNVTDNRYDEVFGFRALGLNALVGLRAAFK
jgi:vitamin B12 transporter